MKTLITLALSLIIFSSCAHYRCATYSHAKKSAKHQKPGVLAFRAGNNF
ncbi:MAG TPA: hypothetical protein VNW99_02180 [Cytophagaceae bacterium]|nr:hypothetical protein [Cytophagaceae bacterium]